MKKNGKYRFSLQFGAESAEQIRAGELLERLGNKKSQIVVAALNEYMTTHPELKKQNLKTTVNIISKYDKKDLENIIKTFIDEKMQVLQISDNYAEELSLDSSNSNIEKMLDNLDFFM